MASIFSWNHLNVGRLKASGHSKTLVDGLASPARHPSGRPVRLTQRPAAVASVADQVSRGFASTLTLPSARWCQLLVLRSGFAAKACPQPKGWLARR